MANAIAEPTSELLYLDNLHVGRRFTSGTHALDERQITTFASEFDPQAFHTDREAVQGTLFGVLAASGWHTAAITMRLQVDGGLPIARCGAKPATSAAKSCRGLRSSCLSRAVRRRTADLSSRGNRWLPQAPEWLEPASPVPEMAAAVRAAS